MSDSRVLTGGSFLRLYSGARIIHIGTDPFISVSGGSLEAGAGGSGHLFDLVGRPSVTEIDPDTGLTVGADRPIRTASPAGVFGADNGAVVVATGSAYRIDTALLEATAPLLNLNGGSALTTGDHAVNLVGSAKVSIPNNGVLLTPITPLSSLTGSLVAVQNGGLVKIGGNP